MHTSHECALTSPEILAGGICNICYKDKPIELACNPCNFDICKPCSDLPHKVSHDFHPEHSLEFCLFQYDRKPRYVICSGCGNMFRGSLYECKECEIYLDMGCALLKNIVRGWDVKEMLHYSHSHLLRRCRPGQEAGGTCLLCQSPVSPTSTCYGCVHCNMYLHERCLDLPTEIQHLVHPAHPLRRYDYMRTFCARCSACKIGFHSIPFGCLECDFDIHLRCADSWLRALMHKSHQHRLFYVANGARNAFTDRSPCNICKGADVISLDSYYYCLQCRVKFHFECLQIPESVFDKSYHIHPLECKIFQPEEDSLEYCGVCETAINSGHHAYSCQECDFLGHIECILRKEEPSPLYLKHLYSSDDKNIKRPIDQETNKMEKELTISSGSHIHIMGQVHMSDLDESANCNICDEKILENPFNCKTTCDFQTHKLCAELGRPATHPFHLNHPLTLLWKSPSHDTMECEICKKKVYGFNLFCRVCNFITDIKCALKGILSVGTLGHKVIGTSSLRCMSDKHTLVQVIVSRSYPTCCAICDNMLIGEAKSCMMCREIYHPKCIEVERYIEIGHPCHPDHSLGISSVSGSNCTACKLTIKNYGYNCSTCQVSFHFPCVKAVRVSENIVSHKHYLYNFWRDDSSLARACSVCAMPCGRSFYGCIDCNLITHADCIGYPDNVNNQKHKHTVTSTDFFISEKICCVCGMKCTDETYSCYLCMVFFHRECIMSMDDREAAAEQEQLQDIYVMYIERDLLNIFTEDIGEDLLGLSMLKELFEEIKEIV